MPYISLFSFLAQFWHDDVRIFRGQNKTSHRRDVTSLVNIWKDMTGTNPSALPIGDNQQETQVDTKTTEHHKLFRHRHKPQVTLARKLRNLEEFADAYNLNLSSSDDTSLSSERARKNVQRMANDILTTIDETNQVNLGSFVTQFGRSATRSRMQTFYQELLDVMPSQWKEIFEQQQQQQQASAHK